MQEDDVLIITKRGDGYKTFSIRIEDELYSRIDHLADESGRSRNEIISILLNYAVDHCKLK